MITKLRSRVVRSVFVLAALALALVTGPRAASAQVRPADKLDAVLLQRAGQLAGRSRVIVEFSGDPDIRVITAARGVVGRRLAGRRAQVAEFDNRQLAGVAADSRVSRMIIDRDTFATMERTGTAIGAKVAREKFAVDGTGVGVALVDSGITTWHDDLYTSDHGPVSRVAAFKDFTDRTTGVATLPWDPYGHGTHVAGIIAGNGTDSDGRRMGIAPGAHLIGLKVLDADGHGYISDVIDAIDYAVANREALNIRIINLSVGAAVTESYNTDPLALAAKRAVDAGIVVVAAAGNLGTDRDGQLQQGGVTAPGNAPWVLTVGASTHQGTSRRSDDRIAGFSSRGPSWIDFAAKPDLVAPGVGIESLAASGSTLYTAYADYLLDGTRQSGYKPYLSLSGTSMSVPVVSGAVALMLEANPALTPNAVKAILQYTAQARATDSALSQGAGVLNARGAVRMARFFADPQTALGAASDTIENERVLWSQQLLWGNYRVTGGIPLPGSNAWTLGQPWGALRTVADTAVIWGAKTADNIVWSTGASGNIVWSTAGRDNIVWSTAGSENIVWSTAAGENIVWSTAGRDNIVWSTATARNIVWGLDCGGRNCQRVIWGAPGADGVWGTASKGDNIVWSTDGKADNIVWSTGRGKDNIVWSTDVVTPVLWPAGSK